jgi:hypothetical protein
MRSLEQAGKRRVSLASAGVALVGLLLLAYGITGLVFTSSDFATDAVDGTVNGDIWLGIEGNGWTNLLFLAAGAILIVASRARRTAKPIAALVALALGAAGVIAVFDGDDVLGVFAANGWTMLAWGAAAVVLLALASPTRAARGQREGPR